MLGHHVRRLADGGLVGALTATSPPRLGHPDGGPKLAGTNPLAIGIPSGSATRSSSTSRWARSPGATWSRGSRQADELVPFGGEQAHKAFALALGLQLLVDALVREEGHGAVLLVARPESDPVPALRARRRRPPARRRLAREARVVPERGEVVLLAGERA